MARTKARLRRVMPAADTPRIEDNTPQPSDAPASPASTVEPDDPRLMRVAVPFVDGDDGNGGGAILWDRMRPATRTRFEALLRADAQARTLIGGASTPGDDSLARTLYDALGHVLAGVAVRFAHLQASDALMLAFTNDEIDALAPLTQKVLDKHIGPMSDEVMLTVAVSSVLTAKVAMLQELRRRAATAPTE